MRLDLNRGEVKALLSILAAHSWREEGLLPGPHTRHVKSIVKKLKNPTKSQFILTRLPSTQEDEGREFLVGSYASRRFAVTARNDEVKRSGGYFGPGNYRIDEVPVK